MIRTVLTVIALIALSLNAEARPLHRHHIQAGLIVSHPAGCPPVKFCGCGAAIRIFGEPIRVLWLAANWFHFPRTLPAPGMVAVRRHHVMVLERHQIGSIWTVYDANSGHHLTQIHSRSIAGFTIVNPHGFRLAALSL